LLVEITFEISNVISSSYGKIAVMLQKFLRKLTKTGEYSYTINIPKEIIKKLKWRERQKLDIIFDDKKKEFKVRDWKK